MIFSSRPPQFGQVCMSMSKTRLSSRAQLMRCGRAWRICSGGAAPTRRASARGRRLGYRRQRSARCHTPDRRAVRRLGDRAGRLLRPRCRLARRPAATDHARVLRYVRQHHDDQAAGLGPGLDAGLRTAAPGSAAPRWRRRRPRRPSAPAVTAPIGAARGAPLASHPLPRGTAPGPGPAWSKPARQPCAAMPRCARRGASNASTPTAIIAQVPGSGIGGVAGT